MKAILFTTTLFLLLRSMVVLADVTSVEATIDKNPVMLDEAIRLTVVANGGADRESFDSSILLKDFVVGRTSVSSQTSIVNFDTKKTTTWTTTLFPRKEGTFTIPAISIEGKQSAPMSVSVIPVQQSDNVARDYFVTTDIDLKEAYLNQQLFYTIKLHLATNIERGSLQSPTMQNAEIKQLGDDKQYTDIVNGRRYQIIERQFAIVPQASGEFTIRGPVFTAEVAAANTNQRFGLFNRTQQVNRVGPDITVNIKPIPAGIDYPWLPSEMARVDEEWPQGDAFVVGEPITRVVTLTALGVVEEQLPEIPEFYPPHFKLYPDQSSTTTVEKDSTLIAQRKSSLAVIPTQAGSFVLPEVTIPWFNTLTEQTEYATIPARTVTVQPANVQPDAGATSPSMPNQSGFDNQPTSNATSMPANQAGQTESDGGLNGESQNSVANNGEAQTTHYLTWLFAGLWVITVIAWIATYLIQRKQKPDYSATSANTFSVANSGDEAAAFKALMASVKASHTSAIAPALQTWLKCLYPNQRGFINPSDHGATSEIQPHLNALQQTRFSQSKGDWKSESMQSAIKNARDTWLKNKKSGKNTLTNLYPST
ncbi:oxygen tolerance protein BatD [Alteromonas sp. 76-1]|uniref:BatD family protein n=1 Tax=Alteromonas sp. 76-1 TaxID=2358187 RepID=UPI000FD15F06|nr:BatD family protein [Alteromonas sp. 76-1]VEL96255.1 oxygen tolerance protein BatD [Alteromonas sp. 76-1]